MVAVALTRRHAGNPIVRPLLSEKPRKSRCRRSNDRSIPHSAGFTIATSKVYELIATSEPTLRSFVRFRSQYCQEREKVPGNKT